MRKDLKEAMPDAVRKHVPELEAKQEADADHEKGASASSVALDIADDMVPDALKAKALGPIGPS